MYCKKCGKLLPPDARFCDRCNTSVRKKNGRMDKIEDLKEERLARRKAKAVEQRLQNIKKIKRRRRGIVLGVIITLTVLGISSAVVSNIVVSKQSVLNNPIDTAPDKTDEPSAPSPTAIIISGGSVTAAPTEKPSVNRDGYIVTETDGKSFAYPANFTSDSSAPTALLSLVDSMGDAKIIVSKGTASAMDAAEAMKKYKDSSGLSVTHASTNEDCYSITGTRNGNIYHRFGIVETGIEFYYEICYPASSSKSDSYDSYAEYMDEYLKSNANAGNYGSGN